MKLLLSSPSSSCSSSLSNASFSAGICSSKVVSSGCLAGAFRKVFCSGGLPTYPSDHTAEELDALNLIGEEDLKDKAAPGIVARLMGLDSLSNMNVDQAHLVSNSISLSRSMNSVDYLRERSGTQPRRVKSTLLFRESPIFLRSENDFLVLSFENVKESQEFRRRKRNSKSRERKTEKLPEKKKEEEPEEIKRVAMENLNDEELLSRTISDDSMIPSKDCYGRSKLSENSPMGIQHRRGSGDRKMRTKERENHAGIKNKEESNNVSEDSSPVSVLDRCQFLGDPELSPSDDSVSAGLNSRRKLSTELQNHENRGPRNNVNVVGEEEEDEHISKANRIIYVGEQRKKLRERRRRETREMIRRLTEAETIGSSRCSNGDFQSVCAEIQWVMLEELIDESVHQLSGTHVRVLASPCP